MNPINLAAIVPLATVLLCTSLFAAGNDAEGSSNSSVYADDAEYFTDSSLIQHIRLDGDFRLRYENINEQGKDTISRDRIRVRAAIAADVRKDVAVKVGVATGGDNPVSTNQTIGGRGSTHGLHLDLAYFDYAATSQLNIIGGKFKNILYKPGGSTLLWDNDWNPEGFGLAWKRGQWFSNFIGAWQKHDPNNETVFIYGAQAGFHKKITDTVKLTAGLSFYSFDSAAKGSIFGDDDDFFGNSFDPVSNSYLYNYQELELFADIGFEVAGRSATVFVDYVRNQDATEFATGYALGFKYGSSKARGTWQFGYIYMDLEADAAFGLLVESDFGGGGTDARGHILKGSYAIAANWNANFTYFLNEKDADAGNEHDFDRLQLDLVIKY